MAMYGLEPSLTFDEDFLDGLYLPLNKSIVFGVVNLNPNCDAKVLYSCAINCFQLSQMISSTFPYSEMIDSRADITFLLDIDGNSLNMGNFE